MSLPVTSGLQGHYDARSLSLSDDDPVTTWPDLTASGYDLTGSAPVFKESSAINGRPAVRSDGVDDMLSNDDSFGFDQPFTVFVVWKSHETSGTDKTLVYADDYPSGINGFLIRPWPDDDEVHYWFGATSPSLELGTVVFDDPVITTVVGDHDGDGHIIRENRATLYTGATGDRGFRNLALFARIGESNYGAHDVGHLLIYDRRLSQSEIEDVEDWLYTEWFTDPEPDVGGRFALTGGLYAPAYLQGGARVPVYTKGGLKLP